jgi:hypothetical protein
MEGPWKAVSGEGSPRTAALVAGFGLLVVAAIYADFFGGLLWASDGLATGLYTHVGELLLMFWLLCLAWSWGREPGVRSRGE